MDRRLLEILACTKCKGELAYDEREALLVCKRCGLRFRMIEGIPDMIIEDAEGRIRTCEGPTPSRS